MPISRPSSQPKIINDMDNYISNSNHLYNYSHNSKYITRFIHEPYAFNYNKNSHNNQGFVVLPLSKCKIDLASIVNNEIASRRYLLTNNSSPRTTFEDYWERNVVLKNQEKITIELLQNIALLGSKINEICKDPIPILRQNEDRSVELTSKQIACLLANAYFSKFDDNTRKKELLPTINFDKLLESKETSRKNSKINKITCIVKYFKDYFKTEDWSSTNKIIFKRSHIPILPDLCSSKNLLKEVKVDFMDSIEDHKDKLQVIFSNKLIGGGVIGNGCVQEEIRFLISPQLIIARLFTEELLDHECLHIYGIKRVNKYIGYAQAFEYGGHYEETTQPDCNGYLPIQIVAMDALKFKQCFDIKSLNINRDNLIEQYNKFQIDREILKSLCCFFGPENFPKLSWVSSGNWGCGDYKGDKPLKFLIQWISASQADKNLNYCVFNDMNFARELEEIICHLSNKSLTIGDLYTTLINYCSELHENIITVGIFDYIKNK